MYNESQFNYLTDIILGYNFYYFQNYKYWNSKILLIEVILIIIWNKSIIII